MASFALALSFHVATIFTAISPNPIFFPPACTPGTTTGNALCLVTEVYLKLNDIYGPIIRNSPVRF